MKWKRSWLADREQNVQRSEYWQPWFRGHLTHECGRVSYIWGYLLFPVIQITGNSEAISI